MGLIDAELAAARKCDFRHRSPPLTSWRRESDTTLLHFGGKPFNVVAHEEKLMDVILVRFVNGHFSRRQAEDQKAASCVYRREAEHICEKGLVCSFIPALEHNMRTDDHENFSFTNSGILPQTEASLHGSIAW